MYIIQSQKQTQEKDICYPESSNQKSITKYTAPKARWRDVAKTWSLESRVRARCRNRLATSASTDRMRITIHQKN